VHAPRLLGVAMSLDAGIDPLVPALQQPVLLTVHVGSAAVAYAVRGLAAGAALAELAQRAAADRIGALPSAAAARAIGHRAVLVAFPILTVAIVLGAVWANLAWRAYWSNDPKELAAAATWLVFGAYLHAAGRTDRWGRLAPWLVVLGFVGVLCTYIGAGLFIVGEHATARREGAPLAVGRDRDDTRAVRSEPDCEASCATRAPRWPLTVFVPPHGGVVVVELVAGSDVTCCARSMRCPARRPLANTAREPGHGADHVLPLLVSPSLTVRYRGRKTLWQVAVDRAPRPQRDTLVAR